MITRMATMVLVAALAATGVEPAHAAKLTRSVIGGGGAPAAGAGSGNLRMVGTAAQGAIGLSNGGAHALSHGYWRTGAAAVLAVVPTPGSDPTIPGVLAFGAPWPNPARGRASFRLDLPREGRVRLTVHDIQGRVVDRMDTRPMAAGRHTLTWDARGRSLGAGAYFARLEVDGRPAGVRRVVIVR